LQDEFINFNFHFIYLFYMKQHRIHTFMHVPFEGLGCIESWTKKNNHKVTFTRFYENHQLPNIDEIDMLIVMGGPMSVYEENIYPWLKPEKDFIRKAVDNGKIVIGICLGSQLIAEVLGATVYPGKHKEIGWFDLKSTMNGIGHPMLKGFEERFTVFHWHGDTYNLPPESEHLFFSDVCESQAFLYDSRVLGLQFHFEVTAESVSLMVENGMSELIVSETVQSANKILNETGYFEANNLKMFKILDYLANRI